MDLPDLNKKGLYGCHEERKKWKWTRIISINAFALRFGDHLQNESRFGCKNREEVMASAPSCPDSQ
jgi:hypothetical protein